MKFSLFPFIIISKRGRSRIRNVSNKMESLNLKSKIVFCKIVDEMKGEQHLKIKNGKLLPLVAELLETNISTPFGVGSAFSLCTYYEQNGDLMQAPEICFIHIDHRQDKSKNLEQVVILPYMYQYATFGTYELSMVILNKKIDTVNKELQMRHTLLADKWLHEIQVLGYLKFSYYGNTI